VPQHRVANPEPGVGLGAFEQAKAEGAYKGRQPTARAKAGDVLRLAAKGVTRQEIASRPEIGVASVYRILAAAPTAAA
jgi:DNA invertase Pin-like site-specific DNA recombinase